MKNPKGHQFVNSLMQSNGNPEEALNQLMKEATPEQRQPLLNIAKSYGAPNELLSKLQNMK